MQKWEQSFPLARLPAATELTVSLSSGQEQLGEPVLPATRILPRPDAFANPSPAAMCSAAASSLFCCRTARGFQQVLFCKTHPWISLKLRGKVPPKALGDTTHKGRRSVPGVRRCLPRPGRSTCRGCGYSGDTRMRSTARWFSALSEMVTIRSVPTTACGNLPELGEKTRSREKAT